MNEEKKDEKEEVKNEKQKRDLKILIILLVVALVLFIASMIVVLSLNTNGETSPNEPSKEVESETAIPPTEDVKEVAEPVVNDDETSKETLPMSTDENGSSEPIQAGASEEAEPDDKESGMEVDPSKTYTNERMRITYEVPSSWRNLVKIYDYEDTIEFVYKEKALFLSIRAITRSEYNSEKDFFNSFYRIALEQGDVLILYGLPNEHPLAREEGGADFKELNGVMSDNYNLIKTIKAK